MEPLRVIKLGGSVICSPELDAWLDVLTGAAAPLVIVPGGGPFADHVREAQPRLKLSDPAAHRMALLAMAQMAWALADLRERLQVAERETQIVRLAEAGQVALWVPVELCRSRDDIEESWSVTSDSLAAWLAGRLGARALYLIKSVVSPEADTTAAALVRDGIVDAAFPDMLARAGTPAFLLGPGGQGALAAALADDREAGAPIGLA